MLTNSLFCFPLFSHIICSHNSIVNKDTFSIMHEFQSIIDTYPYRWYFIVNSAQLALFLRMFISNCLDCSSSFILLCFSQPQAAYILRLVLGLGRRKGERYVGLLICWPAVYYDSCWGGRSVGMGARTISEITNLINIVCPQPSHNLLWWINISDLVSSFQFWDATDSI